MSASCACPYISKSKADYACEKNNRNIKYSFAFRVKIMVMGTKRKQLFVSEEVEGTKKLSCSENDPNIDIINSVKDL